MNKKYVIFGAAGGIGAAVCRQLRASDNELFLVGRTEEKLQALASELKSPALVADATSFATVDEAFAAIPDTWEKIDGVVNCVGSLLLRPAHLTSQEQWDETVAANLTSAFAVVRSATKLMKRNGGSIVLVSSVAAAHGYSNHEAIAATKAGVTGLAISAAATYAAKKIRVNVVAPGLTKTPLTQRIWENEKARETSISMNPLGRLGEPEDIAEAISWLLSDRSSWVTGQVLGIDGGMGSMQP